MQTGASPANAIRASRTNTLHRQAECKTANPSDLHAAKSCSSGDVHVRPSLALDLHRNLATIVATEPFYPSCPRFPAAKVQENTRNVGCGNNCCHWADPWLNDPVFCSQSTRNGLRTLLWQQLLPCGAFHASAPSFFAVKVQEATYNMVDGNNCCHPRLVWPAAEPLDCWWPTRHPAGSPKVGPPCASVVTLALRAYGVGTH